MKTEPSSRSRLATSAIVVSVPIALSLIAISYFFTGTVGYLLMGGFTVVSISLLLYRVHGIYHASLQEITAAILQSSDTGETPIQLNKSTSSDFNKLSRALGKLFEQIADQESIIQAYEGELSSAIERQTEKIRGQRDYVNSILEFMTEGLLVTDLNGCINTTNLSALALTGLSTTELEGKLLDSLFTNQTETLASSIVQKTLKGAPITNQERLLLTPHQEPTPVAVSASLMKDPQGNASGIVCLLLDITERKQFENEISTARDEAIAADKLKSEFLATMSHEIRTPMNGVVGLTSLLIETPLNEEQREFTEAINSCGQSLLKIINDILDFSKIEAGRMQLDAIDFNVSRLVEDVTELFWAKANEKGVEIVYQTDLNLPRWVKGDSNRIRQILTNLVSNAVKFTEGGSVSISASLKEETAETYLIRFGVKDTGIGISSEGREKLFQSFSQLDGSYSRSYGGTGLGLAISKQLVTLMGGLIGVHSTQGEGSEFWFTVPAQKPERQSKQTPRTQSHFTGRIALIAASDSTFRDSIRNQLQSWGVSVHEAANSLETLVLLKDAEARQRDYDILLVDSAIEHNDTTLVDLLLNSPDAHGGALGVVTQLGNNVDYSHKKGLIHAILTKPIREQQLFDCFSRLQ